MSEADFLRSVGISPEPVPPAPEDYRSGDTYTTTNADGTFTHVSTRPIPDLLTLVRQMAAQFPRAPRLAIVINPADVLPDRTLSEPVQAALKPYADRINGLLLVISQGAPVGEPLLVDEGLVTRSPWTPIPDAFACEAGRLTNRAFLAGATGRLTEAFEEAGDALRRCSVQARKTAVAYRRAFGRKPRGMRRHIRRVKAEKRRKV